MKTIIGLITSVVITLACYTYVEYSEIAGCYKCRSSNATLKLLMGLVGNYQSQYSEYPATLDLIQKDGFTIPIDPWGNEYYYARFIRKGKSCFSIWTHGSNGSPGGAEYHEQTRMLENCITNSIS